MLEPHDNETVLITGGAGFIGSAVAKRLGEIGYNLVIVDNFNPYYDPALKEARVQTLLANVPYTLYRVDIADHAVLRDIFQKHSISQIVHLAAQAGVRYASEAPFVYGHSNLHGTLSVLELAREFRVKNVVIASSSSVYGDATHYPVKEMDATDVPISLYAATKKSCELMAHSYHHLYGLPIACLRFFTVYGSWGRPDMALFSFTKAALEGTPIDVFGRGQMARDFTSIDDIVEGVVMTLEKQLPWAILNLGRGHAQPLMHMIELVEQATGKTLEKNFLPMQPGDVQQTWADITQAKALLGWEPQTSLERGIPKFVDWYKNYFSSHSSTR